ncbi:hypothetical protein ACHAWF_007217 [Thalassiosira exigua]
MREEGRDAGLRRLPNASRLNPSFTPPISTPRTMSMPTLGPGQSSTIPLPAAPHPSLPWLPSRHLRPLAPSLALSVRDISGQVPAVLILSTDASAALPTTSYDLKQHMYDAAVVWYKVQMLSQTAPPREDRLHSPPPLPLPRGRPAPSASPDPPPPPPSILSADPTPHTNMSYKI